ncbi:MAG: hypothetical protein JXR69_04330 [Candidatus Delongbacteria bacterium]|nr:hypothetical protein [Candidatus Delongbacteria bacterium]
MNKFSMKEITKRNVKKYSDDFWKKFFDMRIQVNERAGSKTPFNTWEQWKNYMQDTFKKDKNLHTITAVLKDDEFYGYFYIASTPNSSRKNHLEVFYNSAFYDHDKEISLLISKLIKKYFDKKRDEIILFKTFNDNFREIAKRLKGKLGEYTIRMNLPPKEANKNEMKKWMRELPEKNPDIKLKFYTTIPQKLIKEYCSLFTLLMEDMPKPHYFNTFIDPKKMAEREKDQKGTDQVSYRILAFNERNKLIGMTNIFIHKKFPQYPYQYMTGTLPEYRHKGIAKWMKTENFFKITADFKSKITAIVTETSPNNYGSKRTSKLLGFKYEGCEVYYELDVNKFPG